MKRFFDDELDTFRSHLMFMGETAVEQVTRAMTALRERDGDLARAVRKDDDVLDHLEVQIDEEAANFIGLRAPVATALRRTIVGMKLSHDLERVGDEATNIAKRVKALLDMPPIDQEADLHRMADIAVAMVRDGLTCFLQADSKLAMAVCGLDPQVDELHKRVTQDLAMAITRNPANTTGIIELMFVAKSLERIADHATNIAEEVVFLVDGEDIRHTDRPGQ
jgi:phosphate transport system protein